MTKSKKQHVKVLAQVPTSSKKLSDGVVDPCAISCTDSCKPYCQDNCKSACQDSCKDTCQNSCKVTCMDSCEHNVKTPTGPYIPEPCPSVQAPGCPISEKS